MLLLLYIHIVTPHPQIIYLNVILLSHNHYWYSTKYCLCIIYILLILIIFNNNFLITSYNRKFSQKPIHLYSEDKLWFDRNNSRPQFTMDDHIWFTWKDSEYRGSSPKRGSRYFIMLSMFPLSLLGIIKKLISSLKNSSRKAAKLKESKE